MPHTTGKLIVIEGLEGAGKSTAVKVIIDLLAQHNITTLTTREPGGTAIGELLRNIIKNPEYSDVLNDKTELLLLYAARIQLIEEVIKPALQEGYWVIADRFEWSTMAYQGGGRGIDLGVINNLSTFCLNGFKPDLILYLDITPELGMQRAKLRGSFDRIEQEAIQFFHRVYDTYAQLINAHPDIRVIDASLELEQVTQLIQHSVNQFVEQQR